MEEAFAVVTEEVSDFRTDTLINIWVQVVIAKCSNFRISKLPFHLFHFFFKCISTFQILS